MTLPIPGTYTLRATDHRFTPAVSNPFTIDPVPAIKRDLEALESYNQPISKQIRLILPDELMRRAELFAGLSGRKVADVLTDAIEVSLDSFILPLAGTLRPTVGMVRRASCVGLPLGGAMTYLCKRLCLAAVRTIGAKLENFTPSPCCA